jgi:TonB family protein
MKNSLLLFFLMAALNINAQKNDKILSANNWKIVKLAGKNVPEGLTMIFKFTGAKMMIGSEYNRETFNYVVDKNNILISSKGKKETWKIIKLNKNEFIFNDENNAQIELIKTNQDLPALSMKKGEDENFLPPPPPPPPPPYHHEEENENALVDEENTEEPEIFVIVEEQPSFPGCENVNDKTERQKCSDKKMVQFLGQNAGYPPTAREAGFEGTVFVRFVVEADGSISNIEVVRDQTPGGGLKEAAIKAVEAMNEMPKKWNPGMQRGKPVRVRVVVPIKFKLGFDEVKTFSIETDYKAKGNEAKLLEGVWRLTFINSIEIPEQENMRLEFKSNSDLTFSNNEDVSEKSKWKLSKDSKKIEIIDADASEPNFWGIKFLSKDEAILMDAEIGEMRLKKLN